MSNGYFLLFSHAMAIFPVSVCFWEFKTSPSVDKNFKALYTAIHILYTACFSFVYHTYDYADVGNQWDPQRDRFNYWFFLDHWASRNTILTTTLYLGRFQTEYFYTFAHIGNVIIVSSQLFAPMQVNTFITLILCLLVVMCKIRTLFRYFKYFWFHTSISFITFGLALTCLFTGEDYYTWHSVWHLLVFAAAGIACLLKSRLENDLPIGQGRATSDSI